MNNIMVRASTSSSVSPSAAKLLRSPPLRFLAFVGVDSFELLADRAGFAAVLLASVRSSVNSSSGKKRIQTKQSQFLYMISHSFFLVLTARCSFRSPKYQFAFISRIGLEKVTSFKATLALCVSTNLIEKPEGFSIACFDGVRLEL